MSNEKAFEIDKKSGRLTITNSEQFIRILADDTNDNVIEHYEAMKSYGFKQLHKVASDIPFGEYEYIINFAIAKTIKDYDSSFGANILSYFWDKLIGELSGYRSKRDILQRNVNKVLNNNQDVEYVYQKDKYSDDNYVVPIEVQSPEDKIIEENFYERRMKAFKMAFSGLPRELQYILYEIGNKKKVREIAIVLGSSNLEISKKRNQGLSLVLQRVMRSAHLSQEEKQELADLHDIHYEENMAFDQTL